MPFSRNSDETLTGFSQSRVIPYDENVTSSRWEDVDDDEDEDENEDGDVEREKRPRRQGKLKK